MGYKFEKLRLLVVDDSPHMRKILTTVLDAFGCRHVAEASDGHGALQCIRESVPDILIADLAMPGMDGLDLTREIRNGVDTPCPYLPIIMLTGHTDLDSVRAARDAGINEFLAKPISPTALLKRIQAVIEHPRPFVRTKMYFGPDRRRLRNDIYRGPERRELEAKLTAVSTPRAARS
jgi:two-component system, chemotaxis family, chemotaxis protein CheY